MTVNVEIKGNDLVIDITSLLERLTSDDKHEIAQSIGCERDVIKSVVDQLVDGFTENSSHGYSDTIHEQRVRILERVSDIRFKVVRKLMRDLAIAKHGEKRHSDLAWKMYHAWPEGYWQSRPEIDEFDPPYPTDAEVNAVAEGGAK